MQTISASFTAANVGSAMEVAPGDSFTYDLSGTFSGTAQLERSVNSGASWEALATPGTLSDAASGTIKNETALRAQYRWRCLSRASGTLVTTLTTKPVIPVDVKKGAVSASISLAAGAADTLTATITMLDANNDPVAAVHDIEVFIAEDAAGATGLTADTFSGNLTATTGVVLTALTAKKHVLATTDANGVLVLSLEDSGQPTDQYFAVKIPLTGQIVVSSASGTNWGA